MSSSPKMEEDLFPHTTADMVAPPRRPAAPQIRPPLVVLAAAVALLAPAADHLVVAAAPAGNPLLRRSTARWAWAWVGRGGVREFAG